MAVILGLAYQLRNIAQEAMPKDSEQEFSRAISDLCFYAKKSDCPEEDIDQLEQIKSTMLWGVWESLADATSTKGKTRVCYQQILLDQALRYRTIATYRFLRQQKSPLYLVSIC